MQWDVWQESRGGLFGEEQVKQEAGIRQLHCKQGHI